MNLSDRTLVLEVGYEGGSFELYADIEGGLPARFYYETGGPTIFDEEGEPPEPVRSHGPFSWDYILEKELQLNGWLRLYPLFVHPCMYDRVRECVRGDPHARERWLHLIRDGQGS